MKIATLLIIALSSHGYWIGGQQATISLRPAVEGGLPDADVFWELKLDGVRLDSGKVKIDVADKDATIHLTVPTPRTRTTLRWGYSIVGRDAKKTLETGDVPIQVFPNDLMNGLSKRVGARRIVVWDEPDGLPKALSRANVPYHRLPGGAKLQFTSADIVLVGEDAVTDSPFAQAPLVGLAENGASVLVFLQTKPTRLFGYSLSRRISSDKIDWRTDHPLLSGFEKDDLKSWEDGTSTFLSLELPPDEPALEIAHFPREVPGISPAPIDAILLSKSIGKGRIVLCQLPLRDWTEDPRSQMFLCNAIDYLLTRPQPTPRPSDRSAPRFVERARVPAIEISPGGEP